MTQQRPASAARKDSKHNAATAALTTSETPDWWPGDSFLAQPAAHPAPIEPPLSDPAATPPEFRAVTTYPGRTHTSRCTSWRNRQTRCSPGHAAAMLTNRAPLTHSSPPRTPATSQHWCSSRQPAVIHIYGPAFASRTNIWAPQCHRCRLTSACRLQSGTT